MTLDEEYARKWEAVKDSYKPDPAMEEFARNCATPMETIAELEKITKRNVSDS